MKPALTLAFAAFVALSGCSAPSGATYDATSGETRYRSTAIPLGTSASGGGLGTTQITLTAESSCQGEGCTPGTYEVSLSKAGGSNAVADYNQVSFETESGTVSYGSDIEADGTARFFTTAQGEFARISVPTYIFASFAESPTLTIRLGGDVYRLPFGNRAPLRQILPAEPVEGDG